MAMCGLLATLVAISGCTKVPPPQFHLNMQKRNPADFAPGNDEDAKIRIQGRQDIADALYAMYGTPDAPYVFDETGLDLKKIELAAGPFGGNEDGTQPRFVSPALCPLPRHQRRRRGTDRGLPDALSA